MGKYDYMPYCKLLTINFDVNFEDAVCLIGYDDEATTEIVVRIH